jgi:hypothetical protein
VVPGCASGFAPERAICAENLWPISSVLTKLTDTKGTKVAKLVKKAVS